MNVLQSIGFAYGVALVALVPVLVLVLLVPGLRRRLVTGPLRRRLRRGPHDGATLAYTRWMEPPTCMHGVPSPCGLCGSFGRT